LNANHDSVGSHQEHTIGESADIRTILSTEPQLRFMQLQWEILGGSVFDETATSQPHFHFRAR